MPKPTARLTSPSQLVAALPLHLGYVPTESLVVVCCHEPRGRMGLTMRFDLPPAGLESLLAGEVERRVRRQAATRVVVAVYTAEADGPVRARSGLVDDLRERLHDLVVTEAVLVRGDRFWSYLCEVDSCCPSEGRPVDDGRDASSVRLLEAETVLSGQRVLADREALEASLAAPEPPEAEHARERCAAALARPEDAAAALTGWQRAVERHRTPPAVLGEAEAAALAVSLRDFRVRDQVAAWPERDLPALLLLLEELVRRTPPPHDAPVCTLYAWVAYCQGGGARVTIALERALDTDPGYALAQLLQQALLGQLPPEQLRRLTLQAGAVLRRAA